MNICLQPHTNGGWRVASRTNLIYFTYSSVRLWKEPFFSVPHSFPPQDQTCQGYYLYTEWKYFTCLIQPYILFQSPTKFVESRLTIYPMTILSSRTVMCQSKWICPTGAQTSAEALTLSKAGMIDTHDMVLLLLVMLYPMRSRSDWEHPPPPLGGTASLSHGWIFYPS